MFDQLIAKLDQSGRPYTVHEHQEARTFRDVLEWWPFGIENLLKTIAFKLKDGRLILAAVPALKRIDYKKIATHLGVSRRAVQSLSPEEVLDLLGVEPGAVSPVPVIPGVTVLLDASIFDLPAVYSGIGRLDRTLEIQAADLQVVAQADVVSLIKEDS